MGLAGGMGMLDTRDHNLPVGTICIEDLEIGMVRSLAKTIGDKEIAMFAELSTDHNPVHLDDDYARDTIFQGRIAHGMLTAGLISAVIGEQLPGHGTVYLGQTLKFMAPVRPGDRVEAVVEVTAVDAEKGRVTLDTVCTVGDTEVVKGEATVMPPRRTR
jgi:3-hydroxybutyryl-CoA dehydratase